MKPTFCPFNMFSFVAIISMQSHTVQSSPNCRGWFGLPLTIADPYSKLSRRSDGRKRLVVIHI